MQGLNKLILNNTIVEFRKLVRQSRIHSINKLSREIKKLKEKKGTEEQKAKNTKKAERYVQEILIMKKLQDDEISKFALLNEKSLTDITNNLNECAEKKALARLAHHKAVAEKVQNFRNTFPDWKQCLELLLETLGEKYKYKKRIKNSNKKKQKIPKEKNKNIDNQTDARILSNRSGIWTIEETKTHVEEYSKKNYETEKNYSKPKTQNLKENNVKTFVYRNKSEEIKTKEFQKYPKLNLNELNTNNIISSEIKGTVTEQKPPSEGAVDPFFLTKDNIEYISISAKENVADPVKEISKRDKPKKQEFFHDKNNRKWRDNKVFNSRNSLSQRSNFDDYEESSTKPILHPSWEAKKKLTQVVQFEGKRIKFDDA